MRMANHRTAPILAAGALAAALMSAAAAGANVPSSGFSAAPVAPLPQYSPFCDLGMYCDDEPMGLVTNPRSQRSQPTYGGGPLTPTSPNN